MRGVQRVATATLSVVCALLAMNHASAQPPLSVVHDESYPCSGACPFDWEPFCGTDGKTYDNTCLLHQGRCRAALAGTRLEVAHRGTCDEQVSAATPAEDNVPDAPQVDEKPLQADVTVRSDETPHAAVETPTEGRMSNCHKARHLATTMNLIGNFIPQCEPEGLFKTMQCSGSTGYCYCADPRTGEQVGDDETRKPGEDESFSCDHLRLRECWDCPAPCAMPACSAEPCSMDKCAKHEEAECVNYLCGGCNSRFFVNGVQVQC